MKIPRLIPLILLAGTGLCKTIRFGRRNYLGDPVNAVKIFNDKKVDEIIVLDIDATKEQREPDYRFLGKIAAECFMPMTYGGGITTLEQAAKIFSLGVEKVAINTHFYKAPSLVKNISEKYGRQSVVVSIDYTINSRGNTRVYSHGGKIRVPHTPLTAAKAAVEAGAGEILLNCINRDGMRTGYDLKTLSQITSSVGIPVIACGGAGGMEDLFKAINNGHASAVAAGSMFVYVGKSTDSILINYPSQGELNMLYERI
ncbi:MAG: imidazole glycerol phosphate synthase subunit HisF [Bacteroidia bacterium]|nr:imidazole glycerol phosphate synthase subunit HisF [Bacteroidia bacterium]